MNNTEFRKLFDDGQLENLKVFQKPSFDGNNDEIVSFQYNGKFFLRIVKYYEAHYGWYVGHGSARHWKESGGNKFSSFIKEFESKDHANAYFKKCAEWFKRIV